MPFICRFDRFANFRILWEAWGKHIRSESPVELSLGVDLTGGEDWQAASVIWYPWSEVEEAVWVHAQLTVRANGESLTIFVKGYHPFATQGGATLFDDVRVVDLGEGRHTVGLADVPGAAVTVTADQGAVRVAGDRVGAVELPRAELVGRVVQVGKRRFLRLV